MVRYRFNELMAERRFRLGRRISMAEVAEATGVRQATLSKMANQRANATVDTLEKVCRYFGVAIGDLVELSSGRRKGLKRPELPGRPFRLKKGDAGEEAVRNGRSDEN